MTSRIQTRADGRVLRRLTIYLPQELATRLATHAASKDMNMSDVVARALQKVLPRE